MSTIFPRVGKKSLGYNVSQVEAFLAAARRAYDQPDGQHDETDADTGAVKLAGSTGSTGWIGSVDGAAAAADTDIASRTASPSEAHPAAADGTAAVQAAVAEEAEATASRAAAALTAKGIRHTAFAMHKDGYSPEHVDAALERLEDAFAARERDQALRAGGEQAWMTDAEGTAAVLVTRLSRPPGHRFARTSLLAVGYKRVDVDRLANKLVKYFQDGREITVDEIRTAVFRPERGGYREAQVDLVLDSVVDVMLAVR
ncbi:DivIVA domain-containing protein [Cryobacterium sp. PH29-G1]|uniref:DivIVA domain-containing protein n=1 Tax=Cryobacterium sp. PH29-G1 TaxID=3046211 RepID=UPI0024B9735C|nr:DivIVA domain-containing protein [Cryobacterium sp. PH29-G1]MDJ0349220.1 DivIVA domain-containing protein [Cryobacterium sp. PH29-G1]